MHAAKVIGTITKDHRLQVRLPRSVRPGEVEVILLQPEPLPKLRGGKRAATVHPAAGIWADRTDIGDPVAYVARLRRRLETRRDGRQ
jgi:hypothetical protein